MQLRVLHVIPRLDWGSAERQVPAIARDCRGRFDVHVVTCAVTEAIHRQLQRDEATVHVLPAGRLSGGPALARWHSVIRELKPDIVHCWRLRQTWPIAFWTGSMARSPFVVDLRLPDGNSEWLDHQGQRWAARLAVARVVPSDMPERASEWGPWTVIPDQVDESFRQGAGSGRLPRGPLRTELGLDDDAKIVLCVGRLLLRKHIEELIWSADLIKVVRNDTYLAIVGDGPDRGRLEQFRDQVEIRDHVHFLGARYDIPQCMREAHCLWTASDEEDFPLAVVEAQAIGLPVIASDIAAHRQWIEPDRTGILVPWPDNSLRVRHTLGLLDNADLADSLAKEAQSQFDKQRQRRNDATHYAELYERVKA